MTGRLHTPEEVAEMLAVSSKTLRDWLRTGRLKGIKVAGKLWRISDSDLEEFIERSRLSTPTAEAEPPTNKTKSARRRSTKKKAKR